MTVLARAVTLAAVVAATSAPMPQQGVLGGPIGGTPAPVLWPVDEAASRADFFSFRASLQAALARRDVDAVLAVIAPDIKSSFGGDDGRDGFLRLWAPHEPGSRLWEELATVLALGGTFASEDSFEAPYVFSRWPHDVDAFNHVALVGADVRIRAAPREDAEVVGTASFIILPRATGDPNADVRGWTAIRTGNRTGYVPASLARSAIDYRAIFERRETGWQLIALLAGD